MNREQIYAVLIALEGDTLLLPNAAVAEVVARDALQPAESGAPAWLAGYCDWNNRRVPVISFETANGSGRNAESRRARVVVLNSFGTHLPSGLLAIVSQGYPHLVTLNRPAVKPLELRPTDRADLVLARVRIANQEAAIPDLTALEAEISRVQAIP
ncbi:chemotaxis protein CheW [Solimonas sp. K1W22B-7]|uniref:chemotaxis protein CheW n=1 Tax=Solimonas sp. K1W22B-7 TaxID=2303331 RepID=UPI000E337989|nr:chemotaxis protein CheW [Solimonas sp. K1W22B-7]AXQ29832.1 chemotaxis protein CheW [Solimonas sp. K1W22B-7]